MALLSRRSAFAASAVLAVPLPALAARQHPDAELIALCEAHPAATLEAERNAPWILGPEEQAHWNAFFAIRDRIVATRPVTLAGVRAKAALAKFIAKDASLERGDEGWEYTQAGTIAWALLDDLLRLT